MARKDAPLLVHPTPSWHKRSWLAEFIAAIPHYRRNTVATAHLAVAARERLFAWAAQENIEPALAGNDYGGSYTGSDAGGDIHIDPWSGRRPRALRRTMPVQTAGDIAKEQPRRSHPDRHRLR